ncbi:hypothetical protein DY000_02025240 [Brassica cretica]|uniref:Uncharacterized protein n=1 Tax=Brassica cretica TaxID=69181 RepID=A0ABQ7E4I6_BRACR|nr:hypothetical protein DY000_02025240 [Brassica cretica]
MDLPDKDPNPDILKLPGYPIRPRPTCSTGWSMVDHHLVYNKYSLLAWVEDEAKASQARAGGGGTKMEME